MSELRTDHTVEGTRYVTRVLTCFVDGDQGVLVCVGGNKEGWEERTGHDWYDDYVLVADQIVGRYLTRGGASSSGKDTIEPTPEDWLAGADEEFVVDRDQPSRRRSTNCATRPANVCVSNMTSWPR